MDPTQSGGINWQQFGTDAGNLFGTGANIYGSLTGARTGQGIINAGNAGLGMARGAYNPSMFGLSGVGGTGFSVSSPTNGGPGSINANLGAFNPLYGQLAGSAGGFLSGAGSLASTAAGGATGAYNTALGSILPQLQQMQGNLLAQNNNALFQRGQLGSGVFGQYGAGSNPTNLTTASLAQGFGTQDLQAIMAAQNQGLNFFNSNLQGASALGQLGFGATNTGLGFIGAQNATGQLPLQFAGLQEQGRLGATNSLANVIRASNPRGIDYAGGYGGFAQQFGGAPGMTAGGGNPYSNLYNAGKGIYNDIFGGASSFGGAGSDALTGAYSGLTGAGGAPFYLDASGSVAGGGADLGSLASGTPDWLNGAGGFSSAGGQAATDAALGEQVASGAQADSLAAYAGYGTADAAAAGGEGAAAGAGLGATAGALAAGGIIAAPILAGMLTNPVSLTGKYWENLSSSLGSPGTDQEIISMIATGGTKLPPAIDAYAQSNGLYAAAGALTKAGQAPVTGGGPSPTRVSRYQV